jgi:hypothetical protein
MGELTQTSEILNQNLEKKIFEKNPHFCQSIQLPGTDHQEGDIKKVFFC